MSERAAKAGRKGKRSGKSGLLVENPETGEARLIPQGFAWLLFLFSGLLGVPLLFRRLYWWAALVCLLWGVDALAVLFTAGRRRLIIEAGLFLTFLILQLWLGFAGNALTVKAYLKRGWVRAR